MQTRSIAVEAPIKRAPARLLDTRLQDILAGAVTARAFFIRLFRFTDHLDRHHWETAQFPDAEPSFFDLPTCFFVQAASKFGAIIEIGAGDGARIRAIRARSQKPCFALDIGTAYGADTERGGITFGRFSLDRLQSMPNRSLYVSVGTLAYFEPADLDRFARMVAQTNSAIALFEPSPLFPISRSIRRRINGGWYHPYKAIFTAHGLHSQTHGQRWKHLGSPKLLSQWTYDLYAKTL